MKLVRIMIYCCAPLALVICLAASQNAVADIFRDYKIEIGQEDSSVIYNPFGAVSNDFTAGRWWGSSGSDRGLNYPNQTRRQTIYGMWLKLKFPKKNGEEGDTYTADSAGGQAFPEVWRKKDGTELIFRSSVGTAPGDYFWMHVPKTDDTDYRNRFFAQLYSEKGKPEVPSDGTWEKISRPIKPTSKPTARYKSAEPPLEIRQKVFLFAQAVADSSVHPAEVKKAVGRGAAYYGKPYFFAGSDFGKVGFFTFWLFNPGDKTYRSYSVDVAQLTGQALMKTVLAAFEQKAQWVAVYPQSDSPDRPLYITVYP